MNVQSKYIFNFHIAKFSRIYIISLKKEFYCHLSAKDHRGQTKAKYLYNTKTRNICYNVTTINYTQTKDQYKMYEAFITR